MDKKVYVAVNADFTSEGQIIPNWFVWKDGRKYAIDKILDVRRAASLKAGGLGLRYCIRVLGKETFLWFEDNEKRWFMEKK